MNYSLTGFREARLGPDGQWTQTGLQASLAERDVLVALTPLPSDPELDAAATAMLTDDERIRAEAGGHPDRRAELRLGRGLLRVVLHRLGLGDDARRPVVTNEHGAPRFEGAGAVRFGITHAPGLLAVAVTRVATPGLDIERVDRRLAVAALARRVMDDHEHAWFDRLPGDERRDALLRAWVGKEAVLKALGTGVHGVTRSVRVLGAPSVTRAVASGEREPWYSVPLPVQAPWLGCLALVREPDQVRLWRCPGV